MKTNENTEVIIKDTSNDELTTEEILTVEELLSDGCGCWREAD